MIKNLNIKNNNQKNILVILLDPRETILMLNPSQQLIGYFLIGIYLYKIYAKNRPFKSIRTEVFQLISFNVKYLRFSNKKNKIPHDNSNIFFPTYFTIIFFNNLYKNYIYFF